jgi:signal transduction histidine kinase
MSSRPAFLARQLGPTVAAAAMPVRRWPERRYVVLAVVALLFAAIFGLGAVSARDGAAIGLLLAIPIALAALELGLVAGVAVAALGLVAAWGLSADADVGVLGYVTRCVVFLTVGALAGRFSDRMREAADRQSGLLDSGLAIAHLASAADLPLTVARHARAAVGAAGATVELADGQGAADGAVGRAALSVAIDVRGVRFGTLAVEPARPLGPEDHAALATIALQAAVACENEELLASERERVALEAQLGQARQRLSQRGDQLREVLAGQENERRQVSYQLHEEFAQTLAAILIGLRALERDLDSDAPPHPRLETLRSHADATLVDLRKLAVSLRPPVLDLGLQVALERLAQEARARGLQHMEVTVDGVPGELPREAETAVYRIVKDMLEAFEAPRSATVRAEHDELRVVVRGREDARPRRDRLATIGARADLLGGRVETEDAVLEVRIPLTAPAPPVPST